MLRQSCLLLARRFSSLNQSTAIQRFGFIQKNSVDYQYHLTLHKGTSYDGLTNISFKINKDQPLQPLRIDFQGNKVAKIIINSTQLKQPSGYHKDGNISIPNEYLSQGYNNIAIEYSNNYDKDGNGCVSFTDVDGKQYLYTQFQPYFANRVFPIFDQPDIKAPMSLNISCPNDWDAVLSNQFPIKQTTSVQSLVKSILINNTYYTQFINAYHNKIPSNYKTTSFAKTKRLSSYLYCFVVGPYKQLAINLHNKDKKDYIPMTLYSIQSLYPQMQNLRPYIQEITLQSMAFFEKYFGYKYPFSKYDQVFAHEYKWGAMENAGIVTLNDLYLFKDKVSNEKLLSFGNTIVHELAHHWFGNLVTMKWWDDLWLNQSFAQYISHYCLQKIKGNMTTIQFESAMLSFFNRKNWGYSDDELVTTHPIRSEVNDTFTAQSIFDGITYSKGAATMKQLMYLIGQEAFSSALAQYFKKFEFDNAVLDDLLKHLQIHFGKSKIGFNLNDWKKMWLQTAGTNVLSCNWVAGSDKLSITQSIDRKQHATLRLHKIKIALFQKDNNIIIKQALILPQQITQLQIHIPNQTIAILLNYDDLTFAKIQLDQKSRKYFATNLHNIESILSRALIWKAYLNMLKDCIITSKQFIIFVLQNIKKQTSDSIFQQQIIHLITAVNSYTPKQYRQSLNNYIYNSLKNLLLSLSSQIHHSNRKIILRDKIIDFAVSDSIIRQIQEWYHNERLEYKDEPLNNTLRWKIVLKIFSSHIINKQEKWKLFDDMKARDHSDTMINKKIACQSLAASPQQLEALYSKYFKQNNQMSITNSVHSMRGFNHEIHHKSIRCNFMERYFSDARRYLGAQISEEERWFTKGDYLETFIVHMDPICEDNIADLQHKVNNFRSIKVETNDKIRRIILKKIDLLQRRIRIYKFYEDNIKNTNKQ